MNHSSSILGVHRAGGLINSPVSNTKAKRVLARGAGFGLEGGVWNERRETRHCKPCGKWNKWEEKSEVARRQEQTVSPQGEEEREQLSHAPQSLGQPRSCSVKLGASKPRKRSHIPLPDSYPTVRAGNTSHRSVNIGQLGFSPISSCSSQIRRTKIARGCCAVGSLPWEPASTQLIPCTERVYKHGTHKPLVNGSAPRRRILSTSWKLSNLFQSISPLRCGGKGLIASGAGVMRYKCSGNNLLI